MKARNFHTKMLSTVLISAVMFPFFLGTALAAEPLTNASKEIANLRSSIVSVDVLTVPRAIESRSEITEERLRTIGCMYQAVAKEDLNPLLDILASGDIVETSQPESDFRIAVYLHTRLGEVVPLLLGSDFPDSPAYGTYNSQISVMAKKGLMDDLRRWAIESKSIRKFGRCHK